MSTPRIERLSNCLPIERNIYDYVAEATVDEIITVAKVASRFRLPRALATTLVDSLVQRKLVTKDGTTLDITAF